MSDKFKNVPNDVETKIIFSLEAKFGLYDVLYQKWFWEGITAESFIFDSQDVADLSDEGLIAEVKTSPAVQKDSQVTIKRNTSGFDFVNFNFTT
jgi:hypothetical protein